MAVEVEKLIFRLVGDSTSYHRMLDNAAEATRYAATAISSIFSDTMTTVKNASISAFASFNDAMTKSTAIMDVTNEQISRMEAQALSLATKGPTAPDKLAESYYHLASAGLNAEQAIAALPAVQKFATAGAFDMAHATEYATSVQSALRLRSADAAKNLENLVRVTDVVTRSSKLAQGTTQQYAQALTRDAATAMANYGVELETGAAVLAAYGEQAINGSFAGHMFGRMIRLLTEAATRNSDAFKMLNIEVFDGSGNLRNMADIIESLENVLAPMSSEMKSLTLNFLGFRTLSQKALLPLIGMSGRIREFEDKLRNAGGFTENVFVKQLESFAVQMQLLKNQITVTAIEIGGVLSPAFLAVSQVITRSLEAWRSLDETTRTQIILFTSFGAALMTIPAMLAAVQFAIVGLGGMPAIMAAMIPNLGVMAGLKTLFLSMASAALLIFNPLKGVFKLLMLIKAALFLYFGPTATILKWVLSIGAALVVWVEQLGGIDELLGMLVEGGVKFWDSIQPIIEAFKDLGGAVIYNLVYAFRYLGEVQLKWMQEIVSRLGVDWNQTWTTIRDVTVDTIKFVTMMVVYFGDFVVEMTNTISAMFASTADGSKSLKDQIVELAVMVKDFGLTWLKTNADSIFAITVITLGVTALIGAMKVLHVQQAVSLAIWLTATSVMKAFAATMFAVRLAALALKITILTTVVVVKSIIIAFKVLTFIAGALVVAVGLVYTAFLVGVAALKAFFTAVSFVSAVITVAQAAATGLKVAMLGLEIIATAVASTMTVVYIALGVAVATVTALVAGMIATFVGGKLAAAVGLVWGLYLALQGVFNTVRDTPKLVAPFVVMRTLIADWANEFMGVIDLLRGGDMENAFKLLVAIVRVAVADIKDLWKPLWTFLQEGFTFVWMFIKSSAKDTADYMERIIRVKIERLKHFYITDAQEAAYAKQERDALSTFDANMEVNKIALKNQLASVAEGFNFESVAGKEARKGLEAVKKEIAQVRWENQIIKDSSWLSGITSPISTKQMEDEVAKQEKMVSNVMKQSGANVGMSFNSGVKSSIKKLDAVSMFSSEGLFTLMEYHDRLANPQNFMGKSGGKRKPVFTVTPAGGAQSSENEQLPKDVNAIRNMMQQQMQKQPRIEIDVADLSG